MRSPLMFLTPLLAAAISCGDCEPVNLTPDERAWLSAYRPGQQLTFRSDRGATNVLTVQPLKEWHDNQPCNPLESGRYQPIRSTLVLTSATNYGGAQFPSFSLLAYKTHPDRSAEFTFSLAGLLLQSTDRTNGQQRALLPQAITLRDGRRLPAAQLLRDGQNATRLNGSQLRAAYWDQQVGLVRYELVSGEVFDLAQKH
jgi:hypothetical protein